MIVKLIFLALIVWFGLRVYRVLQAKKLTKIAPEKHQDMVSCKTCGVHMPMDEAIKKGEHYFCSKTHLPK